MGYGLDLVRVASGLGSDERRAAVAHAFEDQHSAISETERMARRAMPPSAEQSRLADLLRARFPQLRVNHESANNIELAETRLWIQIQIFGNAAGIGMHPGGFSAAKYIEALRFVWDCLEVLEREGSFATHDPQLGRVLDLSADFEAVLATLSGEKTVKKYRDSIARAEQTYPNQMAAAAKAGPAKPYGAKAIYAVGDLVEHPTFGTGVVRSVASSRVTILFAIGTKVLVCGAR